jgi:ABC-type phosphate transport system substrate-binding protein
VIRNKLIALFALFAVLAVATAASADGWKVVVNASNPTTSISKDRLSQMFLKQLTQWPNGSETLPVDQGVTSAVREVFSHAVHGRSARAIKNWWNQQIFGGKGVPPPELATDARVLSYIINNPGAIGYVDAGTPTSGDVKVIAVEE